MPLLVAIILTLALSANTLGDAQLDDPCASPAPDDWPTWSHDYQHTGASNIPVGDPNQITLQWSVPLPGQSHFTNPTVADNTIYISSTGTGWTDAVSGFNLATGAPIPGSPFAGIPEMGTSNRGNTTIHNGIAYVTGGNFGSITALPVGDLRKSSIIWSHSAMHFDGIFNRFNALIIVDDVDSAGTDILVIGEELISQPGLGGNLYALNAANSDRYGGWGSNPIPLDRSVRHSPAYDGEYLYVGTGDADLTDGSIYAIDARTGTIKWQFRDDTYDPLNPGGFPGGVSIEGDFLYAASADGNLNGRRFKIDKSGPEPVVVWMKPQSRALYGAPTIGRDHLYIPQDNAPGVLVVDKETGDVVHNFAADGVGRVSQNITLSCDNYLFVGDRLARWWVLDANTFAAEFYRQYPLPGVGIVNGTALATDAAGNDYAVVGINYDGTSGRVSAYRLGTGPRPRLQQHAFTTMIEVPTESGPGLTHSVPDAFSSIGDMDVTFESFTIGDPDPDPIIKLEPAARQRLDNDLYSTIPVGADHWTHFSTYRITKSMRLAGIGGPMTQNGEFTQYEYNRFIKPLEEAQATSGRAQVRAAAATTALTRTSNVTIGGSALPAAVPPGATADLAWQYDGTDLGRGTDVEIIRLTVDDPDFDLTIGSSVTEFEITYLGGCPPARTTLPWYAGSEVVYNDGGLGDDSDWDELIWNNDPIHPDGNFIYDASLCVAADSPAVSMTFYYIPGTGFMSNPAPGSGICGFDEYTDVDMGAYRTGGIPGTPVPITGNAVVSHYSDTDYTADPGTPLAAVGVDVIQTEVGANDSLYGDFKLIRWEFQERNGNALTNIHTGTVIDWDVPDNASCNRAALWPNTVNGYAVWSELGPGNAYGMLDPTQASLYTGADASTNPVHGMMTACHGAYWPPIWESEADFWHSFVSETPLMADVVNPDDLIMVLTNAPFDIPPHGTAVIH